MIEKRRFRPGAGILVLSHDSLSTKTPLMLALIRSDGLYDIPKGVIEQGEGRLTAAIRECFEECSVVIEDKDIMFAHDIYDDGRLAVFCASTESTPMIEMNPHTGIMEHVDFAWVNKAEFCTNCLDYLIPSITYFYSTHIDDYNT
jgi:8-oxo-dGTP pyrophosphatase MutT (NUDIX family)